MGNRIPLVFSMVACLFGKSGSLPHDKYNSGNATEPSEAHFNVMMMVESPSAGSSATFLQEVVSGEKPPAAEENQDIQQTNGGVPQRQVSKDIASQADTLDALKKAGWITTDPFEFSTQYCAAV